MTRLATSLSYYAQRMKRKGENDSVVLIEKAVAYIQQLEASYLPFAQMEIIGGGSHSRDSLEGESYFIKMKLPKSGLYVDQICGGHVTALREILTQLGGVDLG